MEITEKGKILRTYGKGLANRVYERMTDHRRNIQEMTDYKIVASMSNVREVLKGEIQHEIECLEKRFNLKDKNKIINYMAEELLEKDLIDYAYWLYEKINSKKAKLIERTFPENLWKSELPGL